MASPTTTTLVVAILRSRDSRRSRVTMCDCGLPIADCGISWKGRAPLDTFLYNPQSAIDNPQLPYNPQSVSRNPPLLLGSPLQLNRAHPPGIGCAIVNQVHAAVARQCPAPPPSRDPGRD